MKLLSLGKDGGPESTVWGFWLIEAKKLFSIALLRFEDGSRDAFHEHAFNSVSWLLKGQLYELFLNQRKANIYTPSIKPIITHRKDLHKVRSNGTSWVLTFRGPWVDTWREFSNRHMYTLTHGRKIVA